MPGLIATELSRHITKELLDTIVAALEAESKSGAAALEYKTVDQVSATSVWAAFVADGDAIGGRYCEDCNIANIKDDGRSGDGVRSYALDGESAKKLWTLSEDMVREQF